MSQNTCIVHERIRLISQTSKWIISKHLETQLPRKGKCKYLLFPSLQGAHSNDNEENSFVLFK